MQLQSLSEQRGGPGNLYYSSGVDRRVKIDFSFL